MELFYCGLRRAGGEICIPVAHIYTVPFLEHVLLEQGEVSIVMFGDLTYIRPAVVTGRWKMEVAVVWLLSQTPSFF